MTREPAKNPAASIRARLLALAQSRGPRLPASLGKICDRTVPVSAGQLDLPRQIRNQGSYAVYALDGRYPPAHEGLGPARMGIVGHS